MAEAGIKMRKGDWVRFQLKTDRRVLEGFVQEISGSQLRVGKGPDSPENQNFAVGEITVLKVQRR